ncbi:hypothetical protein BD779DRAFT_1515557 [Infundibulicybe gibba]|nr:hypothetical protein BD779DRAFT_1515557 [Infundibulicybe gibba]
MHWNTSTRKNPRRPLSGIPARPRGLIMDSASNLSTRTRSNIPGNDSPPPPRSTDLEAAPGLRYPGEISYPTPSRLPRGSPRAAAGTTVSHTCTCSSRTWDLCPLDLFSSTTGI